MSAFDLNLISLYRINGNEWPLMPGLLALNPPRKTARGREQDRLLVYLTLAGSVAYSPAEYGEITAQIAESFYKTSGSMTLGLKTAVEWLNTYLIEHNKKGQYSVGALVLAALRGNSLYIVQCGPTHAYWLTGGETRHFNDAALAGKGLGLSETAQMYFSQASLNANDRMLFCAALPPNWDKSLAEERGHASLEVTRRRLLAITDTNVSALLFQVVEGSGVMNVLKAASSKSSGSATPTSGSEQSSVDSDQKTTDKSPAGAENVLQAPAKTSPPAGTRTPARARSAPRKLYWPKLKPLITPEQREKLKLQTQATARFLVRLLQSGRRFWQKASSAVERLIPRLVPGEREQTPVSIPSSWLAFIALAIPLLVVTVGALIYFQLGQPAVFESYYQKAQAAAGQAHDEPDPTLLRADWETVLSMLDGAEQYPIPEKTDAVLKLRRQAQDGLDKLDRILRVKYRPAFNSPLSRLSVTRMAASDIDVYLLDNLTGSVIRGIAGSNGKNYTVDPDFESCKPGTYKGVRVGKLIDIIALPRSNPSGASLIGIDEAGNLLYCASGETPKAASLQGPDVGWNGITAIAYDANNLYVLDAPGHAVWVFLGTVDIQFPDKPFFFFESQVPNGMEQAVGMTVNGDDLYLLHQDGHLTTCTLSRIQASPTGCTDPAIFVDTRPNHESGITLTDGAFSQILFTSPPDPAVALLEPYTQAIFRFSARALELQNQIKPAAGKDNPLPAKSLTAMAFSPNKVLFVFVDGQLYFAVNIP